MGKKEITARMAQDAGITLHQAQNAFASLLDGIKSALKKGSKVNFSGFGSFEIKIREGPERPQPEDRANPSPSPARNRIKFNPSRILRIRSDRPLRMLCPPLGPSSAMDKGRRLH